MAEAAQAARSSKDARASYAMAQTCYKRLAILTPDNDENSYAMAVSYLQQRQTAAGDEILKNLAALPKAAGDKVKSYGPAHLLMAKRLMAQPKLTPQTLQVIEQHLLRAVHWKGEAASPEAHFKLFELYQATNRPAEAEQHLVAAVNQVGDRVPEWRFVLARWYMTQGKKDAAMDQARRAGKTFRERLNDNLDDYQARGGLIECLGFTSDFAGAVDLCRQGIALAPKSEDGARLANQYQLILTRLLMAWYEVKTADPKSTPEERFGMLEEVMRINPYDRHLLQRLVEFTRQTGEPAEKAKKHFNHLVDNPGPGAAIAHLMLGMEFWKQGDQNSARHHWEKAYELTQGPDGNPDIGPLIANNLAWAMSQHPPVDLERALAIVDSAVKKTNDPKYQSTRGHILFKLERYQDALADLERAKAAYPNDPGLFEKLAECCSKLGMTGEAERYKRRAEELKKSAPGATAGPSATPKVGPADTKPSADGPDAKPATPPTSAATPMPMP
jgi:tetratricopeptide (TPR) repeat protein